MKKQEEISVGAEGTKYGNWMSLPVMKMAYGICLLLLIAIILLFVFFNNTKCIGILIALLVASFSFTMFLQRVRNEFSFHKGKLMDKIQQNLMNHLQWDGKGKVLDVGCGSASLCVRLAKTYENADILGIDYWGPMWDYSESICRKNAQIEGVSDRCSFEHGDATNLSFEDETFDAVVSNFVYHEVLGVKDKKTLLKESLRVLKQGGSFVLQDFFDRDEMFEDSNQVIEYLKSNGIREVYYEGNIDRKEWMPSYVIKPYIIKDIGVFWGIK